MNASILRDFLLGVTSAEVLVTDLGEPWHWKAPGSRELLMTDLADDIVITPAHLVLLCDAVLAGELPLSLLEPIAFGMIASDHFIWDSDETEGGCVAETLNDWACPEINFALTHDTVRKFRHRLLTGEDQFTREDHYRGPIPAHSSSWSPVGPDARGR